MLHRRAQALFLSTFGLTTVHAQDVLQEIVVTATKQGEMSVQAVSSGIRVLTGAELDRKEVRSVEDIARLEPSLQFAKQGEGDLQFIIRGIQSPGASTVGVYFDESVITGQNFDDGGGRTPDIGAYDIERVEVLKGPQGTLFGASSMSGAVRFITKKPDAGEVDANFAVAGSTVEDGGENYSVNGMLNVPLKADLLAVRGVGWYEERGGYIDGYFGLNAATKVKDMNSGEKSGGRVAFRLTPSDDLTLDAFGLYQSTTVDGQQADEPVPSGNLLPITLVSGPPFVVGRVAPPLRGFTGDRVISVPARGGAESEIKLYGLTGEYRVPLGTVVGTVSKFDLQYDDSTDVTGSGTGFGLINVPLFFATGQIVPAAPLRANQTQSREILSSELRFSSAFDGPVNFVAGVAYQKEEGASQLSVLTADPVTGLTSCFSHPECIANPSSAGARSIVFATDQLRDIESTALFGNVEYELTDKWKLGTGLRYYDSSAHNRSLTLQAFQGSRPPATPPAFGGPVQTTPVLGLDERDDTSKLTWSANLGYQATDDHLLYVRAATGFRQGGINDSNSAAQLGVSIPDTFDPDTVLSLEVGAKTAWLDNRLILNAAYFRMNWDDIQVPGQEPSATVNFISNAAEAKIDGIELELFARPITELTLNLGVTWLDTGLSRDESLDNPEDFDVLPPLGRKGDRIPKVPEWALSGGAEYEIPGALGNIRTTLSANFSYAGKSYTFFNAGFSDFEEIGDYFLANLGINFDLDNWTLRVFANNVTDEIATVDSYGGGANLQHRVAPLPRTIGLQMKWRLH